MLRDMQFRLSWTEIVIGITKQSVFQINLLVNKTLLYKNYAIFYSSITDVYLGLPMHMDTYVGLLIQYRIKTSRPRILKTFKFYI